MGRAAHDLALLSGVYSPDARALEWFKKALEARRKARDYAGIRVTAHNLAAATGLTDSDLRAWQKAVDAGATQVWAKTRENEALVKDAARSKCSQKPDGVGSKGDWIWCRTASWESDFDPLDQLRQTAIRIAAVGATVVALVGIALLLVLGRRAARNKPRSG